MTPEIILQIVLIIIGLYLAFFKSYLTEKGKSAALKGDIADLTLEVEKVKSAFNKEQEILKTELQRVLSNEISYQHEVRNALISFHSIISEWMYSILEVGFGDYNKTNIDSLILLRKNIANYYAKAGISKSKIELLVEDKELVKLARELYTKTVDFHHWTDKQFLLLQQNSESQKSLTDRFMIIIKNFDKHESLAQDMAKDDDKLREKAKELFENYYKSRNDEYGKIVSIEHVYAEKVKEYLKK